MQDNKRKPIYTFHDLEVYKISYQASLEAITEIVRKLPNNEKFDLADQLSRSCKAIPRLIAEGFAKKHQKAGFHKYLDDAMAESNETIVSLNHAKDLYYDYIDVVRCEKLIDIYDKTSRMLFKLSRGWTSFNDIKIKS